MIQLRVLADAGALAREAAARVAEVIDARPDALLLAPTGDTPMGCYGELARLRREGTLDTSRLRVAQLDEYRDTDRSNPPSLYGWMDRALLEPLGIDPTRVIRFSADDPDPDRACREYDARIEAAGGIDLAMLGLGLNGHLGFNEPPSDADAPTREVLLTPESVESNRAYWDGASVPERALTAGMTTILSARRVLLIVSGSRKAPVLDRVLRSTPDPGLPASHLHAHASALALADRAARPDGATEA